jgi:uncharacterized membrane-anchored protein
MILKAAGRFLTALLIAITLGVILYLAMQFIVQPIANKLKPETSYREESDTPGRMEIELPSFSIGEFIRGSLSVAKNGIVFFFMTLIVVWFRSFLKKKSAGQTQR